MADWIIVLAFPVALIGGYLIAAGSKMAAQAVAGLSMGRRFGALAFAWFTLVRVPSGFMWHVSRKQWLAPNATFNPDRVDEPWKTKVELIAASVAPLLSGALLVAWALSSSSHIFQLYVGAAGLCCFIDGLTWSSGRGGLVGGLRLLSDPDMHRRNAAMRIYRQKLTTTDPIPEAVIEALCTPPDGSAYHGVGLAASAGMAEERGDWAAARLLSEQASAVFTDPLNGYFHICRAHAAMCAAACGENAETIRKLLKRVHPERGAEVTFQVATAFALLQEGKSEEVDKALAIAEREIQKHDRCCRGGELKALRGLIGKAREQLDQMKVADA